MMVKYLQIILQSNIFTFERNIHDNVFTVQIIDS